MAVWCEGKVEGGKNELAAHCAMVGGLHDMLCTWAKAQPTVIHEASQLNRLFFSCATVKNTRTLVQVTAFISSPCGLRKGLL